MAHHGDVIIIGAGISGISVAYHLLLNNYEGNIVILEANDKIGGRITGTMTHYDDPQRHIELGANWIHGIMGNPIYQIATKHNLFNPISKKEDNKNHIIDARTLNGERIDISVIEDVFSAYFYFFKRAESYYQIKDTETPMKWANSVGQLLASDINSWIDNQKNNSEEIKKLKKSVFQTLLNRETCISGCHDMDEVSLADFGSYSELPGGNVIVSQGYVKILYCLLDEINAKLAHKNKKDANGRFEKQFVILKDHRVCKIKWAGVNQGVKRSTTDQYDVEVFCENGLSFKGHHLVVTIPLGVLKKEAKNLFEPKLPQYKLDCIDSLGFDAVDKIFLEYSQPLSLYIKNDFNELLCIWDDDNEGTVEDNWFKKIYSISKITNHCLLAWVSGKQAAQLEKLTNEQVNHQLTKVLRKFLLNEEFPEADHVLVTKWGSNPLSRGSYTYIHKNSSNKDIELLAQPIYADPANDKPIIAFAGEATHSSFYSTVHGAFLSGRKAANYLLDPDSIDHGKSLGTNLMSNLVIL